MDVLINYQTCSKDAIIFSFICLCVCLSVNPITPQPLEISAQNFQGIILWSKGQTSSKMAIVERMGGEKMSLMFQLMMICLFVCDVSAERSR